MPNKFLIALGETNILAFEEHVGGRTGLALRVLNGLSSSSKKQQNISPNLIEVLALENSPCWHEEFSQPRSSWKVSVTAESNPPLFGPSSHSPSSRLGRTLKHRSVIAVKRGRVLASAALGNGPGVDAYPALDLPNAGIGATLSINF